MEFDDFRIFLTIVRRGTLTQASEEAHLSQPALTRRLQRLERQLGTPLFEREGRRLRLTEAGRHFQERAEAILAEVQDLNAEVAAFAAGARGPLRIGATVTACLYLLPPIFRLYRQRHPQHPIIVRNDSSHRMGELVAERRIDVGVASVLVAHEGVRAIPWKELELALVGPARQSRHHHSVAELGSTAMVLPAGGTLRTLCDSLFARCSVTPPVVAECDSLEVVKELVAAGFGLAVLPRVCLTKHDHGVRVVPLDESLPRLPVALLTARGRPLPPAVTALLGVLGLE